MTRRIVPAVVDQLTDGEEAGFWLRIEADPADDTSRPVYADWLAERDRSVDAGFWRWLVAAGLCPNNDAYHPAPERSDVWKTYRWRWLGRTESEPDAFRSQPVMDSSRGWLLPGVVRTVAGRPDGDAPRGRPEGYLWWSPSAGWAYWHLLRVWRLMTPTERHLAYRQSPINLTPPESS